MKTTINKEMLPVWAMQLYNKPQQSEHRTVYKSTHKDGLQGEMLQAVSVPRVRHKNTSKIKTHCLDVHDENTI